MMHFTLPKPLLRVGAAQCRRRPSPVCSSSAATPVVTTESTTERIFKEIAEREAQGKGKGTTQASGAGGGTTYEALKRADAAWLDTRTRLTYGPRPDFVRTTKDALPQPPQFDVTVCGGTLGIFLACSLQLAGLRVAVVERGPVRGRAQEWNISRNEMSELVRLGVLTEAEVEECISIEFNPVRAGFHGSQEVWTRDVLNLGVRPDRLVEKARSRFEAAGGTVLEHTALNGIWVWANGVSLETGSTSSNGTVGSTGSSNSSSSSSSSERLTARLVLDCMGHASPIVRQIRFGQKPDGVCLVVGTCAQGPWPDNTTGDIIFTNSPSQPPAATSAGAAAPSNLQYFWEAFPAGSGPKDRTTYMFTYIDANKERPSLESLLEDYWRLMPQYQGVELSQLQVQRILFGCFPTYKNSPLPSEFDRILQVGDASGIQSPLSFGGFGALTRHLSRLTAAVKEALEADMVDRSSLSLINAYNPGLAGAWMLQRAMSIPASSAKYDTEFINKLLGANFLAMQDLGPAVLKPFLQDVIQLKPLGLTMLRQLSSDLLFVPAIIARVGLGPVLEWGLHFAALALYTSLGQEAEKWGDRIEALPPKQRFLARRFVDNMRYGAGLDYHGPEEGQ